MTGPEGSQLVGRNGSKSRVTVAHILVVNPGSSSLKLVLLDDRDGVLFDHQLDVPCGHFEAIGR